MCNSIGDFFDEDYFERGRETGKSWYEDYRWMPVRSFKEALAFIDILKLNEGDRVLDIGCAKGFLVRALRELNIYAEGCDISTYSLSFAPDGCWNCSSEECWELHKNLYDAVIIKDTLEHLNYNELGNLLNNIRIISSKIVCIVPLGTNKKYFIPEYHLDKSHLIIENEKWWKKLFVQHGWETVKSVAHLNGIKDNWYKINKKGNRVFILNRMNKDVYLQDN